MDTELSKRWSGSKHLSDMAETLRAIFFVRTPVQDVDLRGIVIGLDGAPAMLSQADFQDVHLKHVDLSYGQFSCAFSRAFIEKGIFVHTEFDTCRLKEAHFDLCAFDEALLNSVTLDDAIFTECSFTRTRFKGRGLNEYGGRRVVFDRCDFTEAKLQNLQLRACTFRQCIFKGTLFKNCLMVGIKFEGQEPVRESFIS